MVSAALRVNSSAITRNLLSPVLTRAGISYRSVILTMAGGCGPPPPVESESKAPKSCCPPKESAQIATNAKSCCPPKVAEGAENAKSCCPPKVAQVSENAKSCCPPKVAASSAPDAVTRGDVSEYYGKTLTSQSDLLTSACVIGVSLSTPVKFRVFYHHIYMQAIRRTLNIYLTDFIKTDSTFLSLQSRPVCGTFVILQCFSTVFQQGV